MASYKLLIDAHAKYFIRFLELLPSIMGRHDSSRITIAFYSVCGLDVLNKLDLLNIKFKREIIDWIYSCQVAPDSSDEIQCGGFQGSTTFITKQLRELQMNHTSFPINLKAWYNWGHLAMTYTAISTLIALGDDLSKLNRSAIIKGVEAVQRSDGSFSAAIEGVECDMRFVFCAAVVCFILDDWGKVNKEKMAEYIIKSIRYDYGISQEPEMEGHGGTTFCGVAALSLSNQLDLLTEDQVEGIKRWLVYRQTMGFQGRPNKLQDTCYSFWIGASLKILNGFHLTDYDANREYILSTQENIGGFSKWPDSTTDPLHTYFGLCALSFTNEPGLLKIIPNLNITERAYEHLKNLHKQWKLEKSL